MHLERELASAAHRLLQRHGALIRLMRAVLYTDTDHTLRGQEARFELLLMVEELGSRPRVADALLSLDLSDEGEDVVREHHTAIGKAREVLAAEIDLITTLDDLYQRLVMETRP